MIQIAVPLRVLSTKEFADWTASIRDQRIRGRVVARVDRLGRGNWGDCSALGQGLMELRLHFGPGYRIYFVRWGNACIVLLAGGDKSTQAADIESARRIADRFRGEST